MKKIRKDIIVNITLSIISILFFILWYWIQKDERYLYDTSFFHEYGYLILGTLYPLIAVFAFVVNRERLKVLLVVIYICSTIPLLVLYAFVTIPGESTTTDISNYKVFDIQVQNEVYEFFPDNIDNYEVIKYDYYYSYPYHHVYNVYLEIRVESNFDAFVASLKTGNFNEREFAYDDSFMEIVFDENLEYDSEHAKLHRGDIQKILYSTSQKIVIFEYFQSWSYCEVEDVYYFERFSLDIEDYITNLD